jgi:hypothetical protein
LSSQDIIDVLKLQVCIFYRMGTWLVSLEAKGLKRDEVLGCQRWLAAWTEQAGNNSSKLKLSARLGDTGLRCRANTIKFQDCKKMHYFPNQTKNFKWWTFVAFFTIIFRLPRLYNEVKAKDISKISTRHQLAVLAWLDTM